MWSFLAEHPVMIALMTGIVAAGLGYGWLESGDNRFAGSALVVGLMVPVTYFVCNSLETDRKQILEIVATTAAAIERNDHERAVAVIGDSRTRDRAAAELPRYDFSRVRAANIKLTMTPGSSPPEALVDIDASVVASQVNGPIKNQRVVRRLILTFTKVDDRWLVTDYEHVSLNGMPDNFSSQKL
ncbi:MAG: hypothetical protein AAFU85_23660 [Planctomycetota bacterium]